MATTVRLVGGPKALIGIGGLPLLTDPTFDPPRHTEGWQHFTEGPATITGAFTRSGQQGQLILLTPGDAVELP